MSLPNLFSFSQSSLQDYMDCARRFELRYIEQLSWPEAEPAEEGRQLEGQIFHRLVQQRLLGLPADKLSRLANTPNLERWWHNWEQSLPDLAQASPGTLWPEITLSSPLGRHRLLAKYDLIRREGAQTVIYDWKTYSQRPRTEWLAARWQTRVYRALLAQAGAQLNGGREIEPENIQMVYWFADYPSETARFAYDAAQLQRDWSALETLTGEITSAATFALTDDTRMCRFCTYRSYCNRGQPEARTDLPETETDAAAPFDLNFDQISEVEF